MKSAAALAVSGCTFRFRRAPSYHDLVSLHAGGGGPPLIAAPCRPQGNKFRGTLEDLSDATFERWVVTEMSIGQPKTRDDLIPDDEPQGTGGPSVAAVRTRGRARPRAGGAAGARRRRTTPRRLGHAEAARCRSQAPAIAATLSTFTGQRQEQTRRSAPPSDHGELQLLEFTAICSRPRSV
jgi:hypothetical protein